MTTVQAVKQIGKAMQVLVDAGICTPWDCLQAGMTLTPAGGTPERSAMLDAMPTDGEAT